MYIFLKYMMWEECINWTPVISEKLRCRMIFPFVSHFLAMLLFCIFSAESVRILVLTFHRHHFFFLGSAFLNDVTVRCNPYIMCITRSTGCFDIMHTVLCFCPINKQYLFLCGIVHWFRTISCLCRHEITIF